MIFETSCSIQTTDTYLTMGYGLAYATGCYLSNNIMGNIQFHTTQIFDKIKASNEILFINPQTVIQLNLPYSNNFL